MEQAGVDVTDGVVGEVEASKHGEAAEGPGHAVQEVGGQVQVREAGGQAPEAARTQGQEAGGGERQLKTEECQAKSS